VRVPLVGTRLNVVPYSASKHGVIALTEAAAEAYADQGIRVNAICPGFIDTPMIDGLAERWPGLDEQILDLEPVRRKGRPDEVASAVLWLCAETSAFVTGSKLAIDGGFLARP
jgi:NAD(P)-dependent dehydrogenase (short-subunit alcohol dehydrogenase family)